MNRKPFLLSLLLASGLAVLAGAPAPPAHATGPTAYCPDFNADGTIGTSDIALAVSAFGTAVQDDDWSPGFDLSVDGTVSVSDIALTVARFGVSCSLDGHGQPFAIVSQDQCSGIAAHPPALRVARTAEEWEALWAECGLGALPLPPVDFASEMVVGVFATTSTSGFSLTIDQIQARESEVVVQATYTLPGPDCVVTPAFRKTSQIVSVPRNDLPARLAVKSAVVYCPFNVETIARGTASQIGAHPPEVRIARSAEEWVALWQEHVGDVDIAPPGVPIDFETEMVVGVFDAHETSGYDVAVGPFWTLTTTEVVLLVIHVEPEPGCPVDETPSQPHHIVKMRRVELPVRLEVKSYQWCGPVLH